MELTTWRELCDRGSDLVLCLDFPGGRAAAGFAELAAGTPVELCFLHIGQLAPGAAPRLNTHVDEWVAEARGTGRVVRAVLGYCSGAALATRVADALSASAPAVVLFDAAEVTGGTLRDQFVSSVEGSAAHLAAGELDDAQRWSDELLGECPDDLPRLAAELADRYDRLMAGVADRLGLDEFFHQELTSGFAAYLAYLLLAAQGGLDPRGGTPLFLSSKDHELPVDPANAMSFDVDREQLMRDTDVWKVVASVLRGERLETLSHAG